MAGSPYSWLADVIESREVSALIEQLQTNQRVVVAQGSRGSSSTLVAAAIAVRMRRPVLLVVAHLDEVDDVLDDVGLFQAAGHGLVVERFGAMEVLPGESGVNLELLAERLSIVGGLAEGRCPDLIVAPIQALMQSVPRPDALHGLFLALRPGDPMPPGELMTWLTTAGYEHRDAIDQPGEYASRGGILDIYPPAGSADPLTDGRSPDPPWDSHEPEPIGPIRLDYFGDEIETISRVDPDTMGSTQRLAAVRIVGAEVDPIPDDELITNLIDLLPDHAVPILHEVLELAEQSRGYYERLIEPRGIYAPDTIFQKLTQRSHIQLNQYSSRQEAGAIVSLPVGQIMAFDTEARTAVAELADHARAGDHRVVVLCQKPAERDRLMELLHEHAPGAEEAIELEVGYLHRGFVWGQEIDAATRHGGRAPGRNDEGVKERHEGIPTESSKGAARRDEGEDNDERSARHEPSVGRGTTSKSSDLSLRRLPIYLIPHHEMFHRYETRRRIRRITADSGSAVSDAFLHLEVGDYVVHVDHGIARFTGLKTMRRGSVAQEFLTLEFAQRTLLHVPVTQIELVQKYVGGFRGRPPLSVLGGKRWTRQKQTVAEAVKDMAAELLRVQASRATMPGIRYPADTVWQGEFEAEFPYDETDDQLAAIAALKKDMSEDGPMDRLICGDVGFGKTEVAIRAAFKAAEYGRQVAVLVPTTVLAEQHERTFRQRMADYPFRIESLSRFKTGAEQAKLLKDLTAGRIDVVIGTHRLLSKDVRFADLGLVIIDEEQRFGVEHKQKLLEIRLTSDVLTLTATPIPRTLHMSMIGLRDISSLSTPPAGRRAIVTEVIPFNRHRIKQALIRELNRDGQAYFVHNRVYNIQTTADQIQKIVPDARVVIGHGQMPSRELEKVMLAFIRHEADILVSTTIIESGIDIPNANTMFINEADHFGLADLHQLRGRVGRHKHRAYCYLLLPPDRPIGDVGTKRLKAIEQYSMLGAGFKIAMRDLEIRGAGNLLGAEQSGHIAAVGYEMYCLLLEQAAKRLRHEPIIEPAKTHLELPIIGSLPKSYISSDKHRMEVYRRLNRATTVRDLETVVQSLEDAYGEPPAAAQTFISLAEIRVAASRLSIGRIKLDGPDLIFTTSAAARLDPVFRDAPGRVSVVDKSTLYYRPPKNYLSPPETLLAVLRKMLVETVTEEQTPAVTSV